MEGHFSTVDLFLPVMHLTACKIGQESQHLSTPNFSCDSLVNHIKSVLQVIYVL